MLVSYIYRERAWWEPDGKTMRVSIVDCQATQFIHELDEIENHWKNFWHILPPLSTNWQILQTLTTNGSASHQICLKRKGKVNKKKTKSSLSFHSSWRWKQGWRSIEDATEEGSSWSPIRVQSSQSQDDRVSSSRKKRDTPFDQLTTAKYDIITRHSLPSLLVSYFGLLLGQSSRSKLLDNIYTGTN